MRKYQKKSILALTEIFTDMRSDLITGFHPEEQERLAADLDLVISTDAFLEKYPTLVLKYEQLSNKGWTPSQERTIATKIKNFWQSLDEEDAERYLDFLNDSMKKVSVISKTCRRC